MNILKRTIIVKPVYHQDVFELLESRYDLYNRPSFIETDPIVVPHSYTKKEDIEIAAFLTATIAWGNRTSIIKNAKDIMLLMDESPYDFTINTNEKELKTFTKYVHRTFNSDDCTCFVLALKNIYKKHGGLEKLFTNKIKQSNYSVMDAIGEVRKVFFKLSHLPRTEKHFADPSRNSAAKRINMFLRWMVRDDNRGVDFGLWKQIPTDKLICPLDVHSGNVARKLDLLSRRQNDRRNVEELMEALKIYDAKDPVKYDFALFGLGAFENF